MRLTEASLRYKKKMINLGEMPLNSITKDNLFLNSTFSLLMLVDRSHKISFTLPSTSELESRYFSPLHCAVSPKISLRLFKIPNNVSRVHLGIWVKIGRIHFGDTIPSQPGCCPWDGNAGITASNGLAHSSTSYSSSFPVTDSKSPV